jgi:hypothetical protein
MDDTGQVAIRCEPVCSSYNVFDICIWPTSLQMSREMVHNETAQLVHRILLIVNNLVGEVA